MGVNRIDERVRRNVTRLITATGKEIVYRRVSKLAGPDPTPNPPTTGALSVAADAAAGDSQIDLSALSVTGRLIPGDNFVIAGDGTTYTVTNTVSASVSKFSAVQFIPVLAAPATTGTSVAVSFVADLLVMARVYGYGESVMAGTLVQGGDLNVIIPATSISFTPAITDKVIIDGVIKSIISVRPEFAASMAASWHIQAR